MTTPPWPTSPPKTTLRMLILVPLAILLLLGNQPSLATLCLIAAISSNHR